MSRKKKIIIAVVPTVMAACLIAAVFLKTGDIGFKEFSEDSNPMFKSNVKILLVENVAEAVRFYRKYFDFSLYKRFPLEGPPTLAVMDFKGLYVMFQDKNLFNEEKSNSIYPDIPASFSLYIDVDDALQVYEKIKNDLEIVQDYQMIFYGRYEFSVKDPNGYIITVSQDARVSENDLPDRIF